MTALKQLRGAMAAWLRDQGIPALEAWPTTHRLARSSPLALVEVTELRTEPAGFQQYLGETFREGVQGWQEWYGCRLALCYRLALYSPEGLGEGGCRDLLDQTAQAFLAGAPQGVTLTDWSAGEAAFDRDSGMFRVVVQVRGEALLTRSLEGSETYLGFEVKGEIAL